MGCKYIFILCVLATFIALNFGGIRSEMRGLSEEEDLELERELEELNKPARKSIVDVDGAIYACVDIDKQLAFDHPLLKNHKIQMPEILSPQETPNQALPPFYEHVKVGIEGERCPEGTVIIRRTRKEELLWAKNDPLNNVALGNNNHPNMPGAPGRNIAISSVAEPNVKYHGASGLFNIYRPYCTPGQFSAGTIWFQGSNPPQPDFNGVQFGWMVNPDLFGDNLSRLFGIWVADAEGKQGCYNMLCKGFIQISRNVTFGTILRNSVYKRLVVTIADDKNQSNLPAIKT